MSSKQHVLYVSKQIELKRVLWIEKVFAGSDELIQDEVMQIVNRQSISALPVGITLDKQDSRAGLLITGES